MTALDLREITLRAERVYAWIGEDPNATEDNLPSAVVEHFTTDMPALFAEILRLCNEVASRDRMLAVLISDGGA